MNGGDAALSLPSLTLGKCMAEVGGQGLGHVVPRWPLPGCVVVGKLLNFSALSSLVSQGDSALASTGSLGTLELIFTMHFQQFPAEGAAHALGWELAGSPIRIPATARKYAARGEGLNSVLSHAECMNMKKPPSTGSFCSLTYKLGLMPRMSEDC